MVKVVKKRIGCIFFTEILLRLELQIRGGWIGTPNQNTKKETTLFEQSL
jgi:hypothetical protein